RRRAGWDRGRDGARPPDAASRTPTRAARPARRATWAGPAGPTGRDSAAATRRPGPRPPARVARRSSRLLLGVLAWREQARGAPLAVPVEEVHPAWSVAGIG